MNILDKIVAHKKVETEQRAALYPIDLLKQKIFFETSCVSLKEYILRDDKSGIIAEFKRKSPSKDEINLFANVEQVSIGYMQAGASALSILTDEHFFGGKSSDLETARKFNYCPILRKDFIVDEYQVYESKSMGADAILLIAACLEVEELKFLASVAKDLGMEVLMEIHDESEMSHYNEYVDIVGVNNRDLKTFEVSIDHSIRMAEFIPEGIVKISESGISDPSDILKLKEHGFDGFLIGERFMKSSQPNKACRKFIQKIKNLETPVQSL